MELGTTILTAITAQFVLCALTSLYWSGLWRKDVRAAWRAAVREQYYDGTLDSDDVDSYLCTLDIHTNGSATGPTVAYVHGGSWFRGTPRCFFYSGNAAPYFASQKGVIGASIGYRLAKARPIVLYLLYPLAVTTVISLVCICCAVPFVGTEIPWCQVAAVVCVSTFSFMWSHGLHPLGGHTYRIREKGVTGNEMLRDLARGVKFLKDRGRALALRDQRIFLVGHSAGAHLSACLLSGGWHLKEVGLEPGDISGVALLCGPLDLEHLVHKHLHPIMARFVRSMALDPAFGPDTSSWTSWKPAALLGKMNFGKHCPKWLLFTGTKDKLVSADDSDKLEVKLREVGVDVHRKWFNGGHLPSDFGRRSDTVIPEVLALFGITTP
ncbi:hypothetical protein CYMTET_41880 [Cymbomonas tetramitiformis]|uniref:protein-S-isoprenylcysteine alpha-carbonyl methylesterase n=1 Tax=Cymbomonas tetramitiformis TaxID=36881 RepID=A0AAE0F272_9CHLO|nr:hypothetical protein CYMTET_41880 [Cymbomonas tetramitiformis]|eukprot:gene20133-24101_t